MPTRPLALLLLGGLTLGALSGCGDDPSPQPTPPTSTGRADIGADHKRMLNKLRKPRRERIGLYLERMKVPLAKPDREQLADTLEAFQVEREAWWQDPKVRALDKAAYAQAYRALIDEHVGRVRTLIGGQVGDVVVQRFVFDGRIIPPPPEGG